MSQMMINPERAFDFDCFPEFEKNLNSPNLERDTSFEDINFEKDDFCLNEDVAINPDVVVKDEDSLVFNEKIEDLCDYDFPSQRCPSFAIQVHDSMNKRMTGNEIQHYFITDEMIQNASRFAAQIACINLSYSTYIPSSSQNPSEHHCCSVCKTSLLLAVSQFFYNNNMDDIHGLPGGMPINPSTPKFAATLQVQQGMEHSLTKILQSLRNFLHIRPTELIHALHYFDVLLKRHWMCSTFILFRQSLKTIFAVCCLIAHKMNSDNPFRNTAWSELFGMPILTINEFERSVLTLLEYETRLGEARYSELEAIVGVGEDYYITLGKIDDAGGGDDHDVVVGADEKKIMEKKKEEEEEEEEEEEHEKEVLKKKKFWNVNNDSFDEWKRKEGYMNVEEDLAMDCERGEGDCCCKKKSVDDDDTNSDEFDEDMKYTRCVKKNSVY